MNRCHRDGWLLPPPVELPADPSCFSTEYEIVGCSNLRCGRCGIAVRHRDGWVASLGRMPEGRAATAALYDAQDWSETDWLRRDAAYRLYLCRCSVHPCRERTPIAAPPEREDDFGYVPRTPAWTCGGHPRLDLPFVVGDVHLDAGTLPEWLRQRFASGTTADLECIRTLPARSVPAVGACVFDAAAEALARGTFAPGVGVALSLVALSHPPALVAQLRAGMLCWGGLPDARPVFGSTLAHRAWRVWTGVPVGGPSPEEVRAAALDGYAFAVAGALLADAREWLSSGDVIEQVLRRNVSEASELLVDLLRGGIDLAVLLRGVAALPEAVQGAAAEAMAAASWGPQQERIRAWSRQRVSGPSA